MQSYKTATYHREDDGEDHALNESVGTRCGRPPNGWERRQRRRKVEDEEEKKIGSSTEVQLFCFLLTPDKDVIQFVFIKTHERLDNNNRYRGHSPRSSDKRIILPLLPLYLRFVSRAYKSPGVLGRWYSNDSYHIVIVFGSTSPNN